MTTETVGAPLVGRAAEVEAVQLFLDRATRGTEALFFEGEPGIGKTRVWSEAVLLARAAGALVLRTVQRRLRRKRAARETLREAYALFERLGAPIWAGRTEAELRRIGGRSSPAAEELSATEERIVDLARSGRTNREIAEAMSLSPKTVEWNLSKIYRKLAVRSRTERAGTRGA